jgi:hypothetical protein
MSVLDIRRGVRGLHPARQEPSCTPPTHATTTYHKGGCDIYAPNKIRTHDFSVEAVQDRKHPELRGSYDDLH